jgi:Holliday junction resolvase
MSKINGCRKGKAQEREACRLLTRLGWPTERNARNGKSEPDLVTPFVNLHLEIKSAKAVGLGTVALTAACDQAKRDAAANERRAWAVLWKDYGKGWRLTFPHGETHPTVCGDDDIKTILEWLERGL